MPCPWSFLPSYLCSCRKAREDKKGGSFFDVYLLSRLLKIRRTARILAHGPCPHPDVPPSFVSAALTRTSVQAEGKLSFTQYIDGILL